MCGILSCCFREIFGISANLVLYLATIRETSPFCDYIEYFRTFSQSTYLMSDKSKDMYSSFAVMSDNQEVTSHASGNLFPDGIGIRDCIGSN